MKIYLIRHGESEDNQREVYSKDQSQLTPQGIKDILALKEKIDVTRIEKVIVSPLERAKDTAKFLGITSYQTDTRIKEYNFGIFAGLSYEAIKNIYEAETKTWIKRPFDYKIPQGESLEEKYKDIKIFLEALIKAGEDTLLITHGGVIRLILADILGGVEYFYTCKVDTASLSIIEIDNNFGFISLLNKTGEDVYICL